MLIVLHSIKVYAHLAMIILSRLSLCCFVEQFFFLDYFFLFSFVSKSLSLCALINVGAFDSRFFFRTFFSLSVVSSLFYSVVRFTLCFCSEHRLVLNFFSLRLYYFSCWRISVLLSFFSPFYWWTLFLFTFEPNKQTSNDT